MVLPSCSRPILQSSLRVALVRGVYLDRYPDSASRACQVENQLSCPALLPFPTAYDMAKRIIHLVVKVGDLINKDPDTKDLLRLYFLPDYNVSLAELIIPGTH